MKWGFPVALVIKHLPASAGDRGSIPGPGRFHVPQTAKPAGHSSWSPRAQSLCCTTGDATAQRSPRTKTKGSLHSLQPEQN